MGEDLGGWSQMVSGGHANKTLRVGEDKNRQRGNGRGGSFQASRDSRYILAVCTAPRDGDSFIHRLTYSLIIA